MSGSAAVNFKFEARSGQAYEQMMGRRSRILAPLFIQFSGIADGDRVLDVGCGTGVLPAAANVARVAAIDRSDVYIEYARSRNTVIA
jgi:2-polyprenyl-3-methyl-5-hydroxy-6-metoxy-1,4-benzoquinol methylase